MTTSTTSDRNASQSHPHTTASAKALREAIALFVTVAKLRRPVRTVLRDTESRLQCIPTIYQRSLNASMVRVGELFRAALQWNSAALIVAHNHPSGDPTPSPEDVLLTREIVEAGKLLDIDVLHHLVIGLG